MIVILRPKTNANWAGYTRFKNCYDYLGPILTRSGRRYTGLTEDDEKRLGEKLNLDLRPSSEFWDNFVIPMTSKDLYLDTDIPEDELKYLFLKSHKRVQPSLNEVKPGANYVLINQDKEAEDSNKFNRIKVKAVLEFHKLNTEAMRKALRICAHQNADKSSNEVVESKLFEFIEGNPQKFLDKWVNNKSRETEVIIERAVSEGIIRKNKSIYSYGQDVIGNSREDAIAYLDNPKNQDIKKAIMKDIE